MMTASIGFGRRRLVAMALLATTALAVGTIAMAQESGEPDGDDTVIVWGTQVSSSSLYLGEDEIAIKQADHLSDLLRVIPGVDIGGTHSVNQRINFRGLDDRDLDIFIDGAKQTNYLYHHMGNLLINADILKSADIQLGTNTVTHGGLGGALHFDTKDAADLLTAADRPFGARLMGSYHTNAQWSASVTGYAQLGERFDVLAYFNHVDRDNFEDGDGVSTIGSDGETDNYLVKGGFTITPNQRLEVSYERIDDAGDYTQRPDMGVRTNEAITGDILLPTDYDRETINVGYELNLDELVDLRVTYYTNDLTLWRDERAPVAGGGFIKEASSDNQGVNVLAVSLADWGGVEHAFSYGLEYFDQNLSYIGDVEGGADPVEEDSDSLAVFVEDAVTFANGWVLRPGVRFNRYEQTIAQSASSDEWDAFTFGVAGEIPVSDSLRLLASYTELFKGPELAEPFVGGAADKVINPDLEPETGDNIEIGFRYSEDVGGGTLNVGANIFRQTIDNYIGEVSILDADGVDTGLDWDVNRGTARFDGFEFSANYSRGDWDLLFTYARSELDDDELEFNDTTESLREIGDMIGTEVSYALPNPNITVSYNALYVLEQDIANADPKPAYDVHNIYARWQEPGGVSGLALTFGVDNLFDEFYTSHASRTGSTVHPVFGPLFLDDVEPGRNIKLTISQSF